MTELPPGPLRLGQIGTGAWGRRWLSVLDGSPAVELVAVADVDVAAAEASVDRLSSPVACFGSVDALASAELALDAVIVVVPAEAHADVVCQAVGTGWHCLVEKPVAHSVAAGRQMMAAAEAGGRAVMVSHNMRFGPASQMLQRLVAGGRIGAVGQVWIDHRANLPFEGFMVEIDEPLIGRFLVHHLDLCRFVLGTEFRRVRARSWNPSWSRFAGNASAVVELEGQDGAVVVHRGSWCAPSRPTQWEGSWEIEGNGGALGWHDGTVTLRPAHPFDTADVPGVVHRGDHLEVALAPPAGSQQAAVLAAFVDAVRWEVPPRPGIADALGTVELLIAALVSVNQGGEWVDVAEASRRAQLGPRGLVVGAG